jgi:hypothetical protein
VARCLPGVRPHRRGRRAGAAPPVGLAGGVGGGRRVPDPSPGQAAAGFGDLLRAGGLALGFEAGFVLAGTVLPLALVYRWGQVFPGWVPLLAGRGVPRWLVLGPALGLGVGMTAYFGISMVKLAAETVTGTWTQHAGSYPSWFTGLPCPPTWPGGWGLGLRRWPTAARPAPMPDLRPLTAGPPSSVPSGRGGDAAPAAPPPAARPARWSAPRAACWSGSLVRVRSRVLCRYQMAARLSCGPALERSRLPAGPYS